MITDGQIFEALEFEESKYVCRENMAHC